MRLVNILTYMIMTERQRGRGRVRRKSRAGLERLCVLARGTNKPVDLWREEEGEEFRRKRGENTHTETKQTDKDLRAVTQVLLEVKDMNEIHVFKRGHP